MLTLASVTLKIFLSAFAFLNVIHLFISLKLAGFVGNSTIINFSLFIFEDAKMGHGT